jgi:hypothetical protein
MSRAREHEVSSPISLFPFIGILLCTMGALLVVLVVVSRDARDSAQRDVKAKQSAAKVDDGTQKKIACVQKYVGDLAKVRNEAERKLHDEHQHLSNVEDHIRRLQDKMRSLQLAANELEGLEREHYDDRAQAEREVERLNQLIEESKKSIEKLQGEAEKAPSSYAVVPYEGPNGTHRRPMYVECVDDGVVLQPEGVRIPSEDLRPPYGPGNPLAATLRATRDHILKMYPKEGENRQTEPYPLLLVRAEGLVNFDRARQAIEGGDFDLGFELVEDSWKLKFPQADPQLASIQQTALVQARARQQVLAAAAPRAYRSEGEGERDGYDDDARDGSSDSGYGGEGGGGYGNGGSGGGGIGSGGNGGGGRYASRSSAGGGSGMPGGSGGNGAPGNGGSGAGPGGSGLAGANGMPGGGSAVGSGSGGFVNGGGGVGAGTGGGSAGVAGGAGQEAGIGMPGSGLSGPAGPPSEPIAGAIGATGGGGTGGSEAGGYGGAPGGMSGSPGGGGMAGGYGGAPGNSGGGAMTGSGGMAGGATSGGGMGGNAGGAGMTSSASGMGSSGSPAMASTDPSMPPDANGQQGVSMMYGSPPPDASQNMRDDEKRHHSLAETRGKDWALKQKPQRAIAVRRTIRVVVQNNQLRILPEGATVNSPGGKVIPMPGDTVQSLDPFVKDVRDEIDGWGMAGNGLYWRPVIVLSVAPQGERRASDLERWLSNSGLELKTDETANTAPPRKVQ